MFELRYTALVCYSLSAPTVEPPHRPNPACICTTTTKHHRSICDSRVQLRGNQKTGGHQHVCRDVCGREVVPAPVRLVELQEPVLVPRERQLWSSQPADGSQRRALDLRRVGRQTATRTREQTMKQRAETERVKVRKFHQCLGVHRFQPNCAEDHTKEPCRELLQQVRDSSNERNCSMITRQRSAMTQLTQTTRIHVQPRRQLFCAHDKMTSTAVVARIFPGRRALQLRTVSTAGG